MKMLKILVLILIVALSGCANQYKQFYRPVNTDALNRAYQNREHAPLANPLVERVSPAENPQVLERYARKGYAFIGYSSFNSGKQEGINSAIAFAKEIQADLVVVSDPQFTGSQTTVVPVTTPTSTTSFSSGTASAYGSGGVVNVYGSGVTTTYGSFTSMVPVTVNRMDYSAAFFVKMKVRFGAFFRDLNDDERRAMQTNKGSVIRLVVDGSPAFSADLLAGDVITAVNGAQIESTPDLMSTIESQRGQKLILKINRGGSVIEKFVLLTN
jgi:hypothetical protein